MLVAVLADAFYVLKGILNAYVICSGTKSESLTGIHTLHEKQCFQDAVGLAVKIAERRFIPDTIQLLSCNKKGGKVRRR